MSTILPSNSWPIDSVCYVLYTVDIDYLLDDERCRTGWKRGCNGTCQMNGSMPRAPFLNIFYLHALTVSQARSLTIKIIYTMEIESLDAPIVAKSIRISLASRTHQAHQLLLEWNQKIVEQLRRPCHIQSLFS